MKSHEAVRAGDVNSRLRLSDSASGRRNTPAARKFPGRERWAIEYGPLLYGALGAPNPITLRFNPAEPEAWFTPVRLRREGREVAALKLKGDDCHEYRAYADIDTEPFDVYPIVEK